MTTIEENIIKDYLSMELTLPEIGKKYNISTYKINNILKNNQIKKYDFHLTLPQNKRKYPLNDFFFDEQSEDMAYVLGILASDGTVRKDSNEVKLTLASVDKEFLEQLQKMIGGRPIKEYETQKGFKNVTWEFSSRHIKEKLSEYNIVPNKTYTFTFPKKLKTEYYRDFIRGYFDGDGCISTAGPNAIRFQIGSKTKDVLEIIIAFFEENNIPPVSIYKRQDNFYYFQYATGATRQIYHLLYDNANLFLPRKKTKYQSLI